MGAGYPQGAVRRPGRILRQLTLAFEHLQLGDVGRRQVRMYPGHLLLDATLVRFDVDVAESEELQRMGFL